MFNPDSLKLPKIHPAGNPQVAPKRPSQPSGSFRFAFTKRKLEALAPPASDRAVYYDTEVHGLLLRVSVSGHKSFSLYRKVQGRPQRLTIGDFPDITVEQARNRARQLNNEIGLGGNPAVERRTLRAEMTFGELFADYLEHYAKPRKRTWKEDSRMFRLYLGALSERKISAITKSDLAALHRRIGKRAPYAANRVMELVSSMYNRACNESGWSGENPAQGIKAFKEEKRQRFLDAEELPRFFHSLAEEPNTTIRDFIVVALLTGGRRRNVASMRWDEIRWARAVWEVPGAKAKGGKPMDIMLIPAVIRLLDQRQKAAEADAVWVFPGSGKSGHLEEPKSAWKRILKRAHLRDVRLHDLRRTLGSWQAMQGASLTVIGASLGHSSIAATQVYARLNADPVRASVERATNAMLAAANPPPELLTAKDGHE